MTLTKVKSLSLSLHEIFGQPFGAGHAVPNFCRIAEWLARVMQRLYKTTTDHFFDDFFLVEPTATIDTAVFCLRPPGDVRDFATGIPVGPGKIATAQSGLRNTRSLL